MTFLLGANFSLALFLLLLLARRNSGPSADRWLMAQLGTTAILALGLMASLQAWPIPRALALLVGGSGFMLLPVFFHLYLREMMHRKTWVDTLWLLPFGIHFSWLIFLDSSSGSSPLEFAHGLVLIDPSTGWLAQGRSLPIFIFVFLPALELVQLRFYDDALRERFSTLENIDLRWVRNLLVALMFVVATSAFVMSFGVTFVTLSVAFSSVLVLLLGYSGFVGVFALAQPAISSDVRAQGVSPVPTPSASDVVDFKLVLDALHHDGFYREENCSLDKLAAKLKKGPAQVSVSIREATDSTFYDLVNRLRAEEAARLLADPKNRDVSILAIAHDAGFQSKATFNRVFKQHLNATPSAYREDRLAPVKR